MATVSVIVPVYNSEKYLKGCLDSILSQTFPDFELFLVDDGSVDHSGRICDQYAEYDQRIHVFHQANKGQGTARNVALEWIYKNSDSKYITFVDSDDIIHPRYIELLFKALQKYNVRISQCLYIEKTEFHGFEAITEDSICVSSKEAYVDWYCAFMCCKMFHKDCLKNIRFPEGQIYEDVAIWYQILFQEEKIAIVKDKLYFYYINQNSTVRSEWNPKRLAQIDVWNKQVEFFLKYGDELLIDSAFTHYFQIVSNQIEKIKLSRSISKEEKKGYIRSLRRQLRDKHRLLPANKYINTHKNWYLLTAYPEISWIYWTCNGVIGKVKRVFLKEGR